MLFTPIRATLLLASHLGCPVSGSGDITRLLHLWRHGDHDAENALFTEVLPSLRRIAHYLMNRERPGHTLQATELVDQIYFRLTGARDRDWRNRAHFYAIAGRAMRRYLIDYARARPHAAPVPLDGLDNLLAASSANLDTALSIDHLLSQLAAEHPDWCTLVELKYFLGLTDEEAADVLHMKLRTMQRTWLEARQWLFSRLEAPHAAPSHSTPPDPLASPDRIVPPDPLAPPHSFAPTLPAPTRPAPPTPRR